MTLQHRARWTQLFCFTLALFLLAANLTARADDANPREIFAQGFYLLENGQASKAIDKFEQGLKIGPNNAAAHYYLGEAYRAMSKDELAKQHYERSLLIDSNSEVANNARKRLDAGNQ